MLLLNTDYIIGGTIGLIHMKREYLKIGINIRLMGMDKKAPKTIYFDNPEEQKKRMRNYLWN